MLGGGLMGSLFTETSDVELSLWPETKYNVQVTCKNKVSYREFFNIEEGDCLVSA